MSKRITITDVSAIRNGFLEDCVKSERVKITGRLRVTRFIKGLQERYRVPWTQRVRRVCSHGWYRFFSRHQYFSHAILFSIPFVYTAIITASTLTLSMLGIDTGSFSWLLMIPIIPISHMMIVPRPYNGRIRSMMTPTMLDMNINGVPVIIGIGYGSEQTFKNACPVSIPSVLSLDSAAQGEDIFENPGAVLLGRKIFIAYDDNALHLDEKMRRSILNHLGGIMTDEAAHPGTLSKSKLGKIIDMTSAISEVRELTRTIIMKTDVLGVSIGSDIADKIASTAREFKLIENEDLDVDHDLYERVRALRNRLKSLDDSLSRYSVDVESINDSNKAIDDIVGRIEQTTGMAGIR